MFIWTGWTVSCSDSCGRLACYFVRLHDFSVTLSRCYQEIYVNSFFPHTARLLNCLSTQFFPQTFDLNSHKSKHKRHLCLGSLQAAFLFSFNRFFSFLTCIGSLALHWVNPKWDWWRSKFIFSFFAIIEMIWVKVNKNSSNSVIAHDDDLISLTSTSLEDPNDASSL